MGAAIIITLPVFTIFGSMICANYFKCEEAGIAISIFVISLSALFDMGGLTLLIFSMVQAAGDLESPAGPIVCGTFATFFVLVSAISNVSTICSYGIQESKKENKNNA